MKKISGGNPPTFPRLFVPLYAELNTNNSDKPQSSGNFASKQWIKLQSNLLLTAEWQAISLQTRGTFASILLCCGLLDTAYLNADALYLSKVLACDKRTLESNLLELEKHGLIQRERERDNIRDIETRKTRKKKNASTNQDNKDCPSCRGKGKILYKGNSIDCKDCEEEYLH